MARDKHENFDPDAAHSDPVPSLHVEGEGSSRPSGRKILKFGGTVCGRMPLEVVKICSSTLKQGPIAVVCSARSGKTKVEGTTNLLLKAVRDAAVAGSKEFHGIIDDILRQHQEAANILSPQPARDITQFFQKECEELRSFLASVSQDGSLDPEVEDRAMGVGEKLSAAFMASLLEDRGIPATYIDLSNVVNFEVMQGFNEDFYSRLSPLVGRLVEDCGSRVPVITGFFGKVPGGLLKDCGRGYSDVLSAIVAAGADGTELQIWKEVSGVYTADPRKVPTAQPIDSLHYLETRELSFFGSEVIHHLTMDICMRRRMPIRIKNALDPEGPGTVVLPDAEVAKRPRHGSGSQKPTAVTVKDNITIVNVHSHRKASSPEFLEQICKILRERCLSVDLFELNEAHVSLAVHSKSPFITMRGKRDKQDVEAQHRELQAAISQLETLGTVHTLPNMAILSLIGKGLKRSYGIAGRLFSALGSHRVNIEMISQGASEINISCVIEERDALRALSIVHAEMFTFST